MDEFVKTLLIACIPALITGIISYLVAHRNSSAQIKVVKEQNKHDLERLMEQHKIDIEALKEKYRLEAEEKEKDQTRKLELMQKEYEYKLKQQEKEAENNAKFGAIKDVFGGLVGGMISSAMNTPELQKQMSDSFSEAFKKKDGEQ